MTMFFHRDTTADDDATTGAPGADPRTTQTATALDATSADHPDDADRDDADDIDADLAPQPTQRLGLLTGVLAMLAVVALGFLVGAYVQKHHGATSTASGARAAGGGRVGYLGGNAPAGFAADGRTGGGQGASLAAGTDAAVPAQASTAVATPAVIGTIVSITATTATVKNLGGKQVVVRLLPTTTITLTVKASRLKVGETVAVVGTAKSGSITATSITVQ